MQNSGSGLRETVKQVFTERKIFSKLLFLMFFILLPEENNITAKISEKKALGKG